MIDTKHTPTPWESVFGVIQPVDPKANDGCNITRGVRSADAAFIILAVNNWEALLAAGKELLALIDAVGIDQDLGDETDRVFPRYEFDGLRAAINKAEGR